MNDESVTVEHIRSWLNTGILSAILIFVARFSKPVVDFLIERRKLLMAAKREDRQGYGELIELLTAQVEALGKRVGDLTAENSSLRDEVRSLHSMMDGMRRGNLAESMSAQRSVIDALGPEAVSKPMQRALNTLDNLPKGTPE